MEDSKITPEAVCEMLAKAREEVDATGASATYDRLGEHFGESIVNLVRKEERFDDADIESLVGDAWIEYRDEVIRPPARGGFRVELRWSFARYFVETCFGRVNPNKSLNNPAEEPQIGQHAPDALLVSSESHRCLLLMLIHLTSSKTTGKPHQQLAYLQARALELEPGEIHAKFAERSMSVLLDDTKNGLQHRLSGKDASSRNKDELHGNWLSGLSSRVDPIANEKLCKYYNGADGSIKISQWIHYVGVKVRAQLTHAKEGSIHQVNWDNLAAEVEKRNRANKGFRRFLKWFSK